MRASGMHIICAICTSWLSIANDVCLYGIMWHGSGSKEAPFSNQRHASKKIVQAWSQKQCMLWFHMHEKNPC